MPHPDTLLAHAGGTTDPATGAVVPPLHLATTFERGPDGSYPGGYQYARSGNPTRARLETALARLEAGPDEEDELACAAFASGMAASAAVLQTLAAGAHVVVPDDAYYGLRVLLSDVMARWGLAATAADLTDLGALQAALRPETRLVWVETPSNPLLKITDVAAVAEVARTAGARVVVDGTWTTPLLQRPLALGADAVVHSVTKYLAGHSDVLGGAVVARAGSDLFARLRDVQAKGGPVMEPFGAWLALRGLRTLSVRLERQCATALHLARFLARHPRVTGVHYPGLDEHPGHAAAARQMSAYGGMLSFEVDGSADEARAVASRCTVFTEATSLGGTESLIEHRASVEDPGGTTPPTLLRCSVGLEHAGDLVDDLSQALG